MMTLKPEGTVYHMWQIMMMMMPCLVFALYLERYKLLVIVMGFFIQGIMRT